MFNLIFQIMSNQVCIVLIVLILSLTFLICVSIRNKSRQLVKEINLKDYIKDNTVEYWHHCDLRIYSDKSIELVYYNDEEIIN